MKYLVISLSYDQLLKSEIFLSHHVVVQYLTVFSSCCHITVMWNWFYWQLINSTSATLCGQ